MKLLFLIGGFLGFGLVCAAGLSAGREPDLVLRDASVGCLAGAVLLKWFWGHVVEAIRVTVETRRAQMAADQETDAAKADPLAGAAKSR
jgi:hypothetical protein